jgi:hypothetical protein
MRLHFKSSALIALCASTFAMSQGVRAQTAPPQKYDVITVEVKPGANAQFEEFVHKLRDAVEKNKGPEHWLASQSMSGNPVYTFSRPFGTWAGEFGQAPSDPLVKAYGEQEAARLAGLLAASVASESTAIYVARPDLSRPRPPAAAGAPAATPVAVEFLDLNVKLGKEQQFEGYVKKLIEATNKAAPNAYWEMRQRQFGPGNAAGYRVVLTFAAWADLDKPPEKSLLQRLTEQFGAAEGERLQGLAMDALQGENSRLNRVRSDLARPPTT